MSWAVGGAGGREDEAGRWIGAATRRREEGRIQSGIEGGAGSYAVAGMGIEWGWWGAAGWRERYGGRGEVGAVGTMVESPQPRPANCAAY